MMRKNSHSVYFLSLCQERGIQDMDRQFSDYSQMVFFLRDMLPGIYDVLLFEFSGGKCVLTEQSDWSSTNTAVVQKRLTSLLRNHRKEGKNPDREQITEVNGNRLMKLFILYIKEEERVRGALVVCMECDVLIRANTLISDMLGRDFSSRPERTDPDNLSETIASVINEYCSDPADLKPSERTEIFADLYDMEVFRIKGAVVEVANALGISDKSAYRYISRIKRARH
jgi:predicted transcriptional regulator YheO